MEWLRSAMRRAEHLAVVVLVVGATGGMLTARLAEPPPTPPAGTAAHAPAAPDPASAPAAPAPAAPAPAAPDPAPAPAAAGADPDRSVAAIDTAAATRPEGDRRRARARSVDRDDVVALLGGRRLDATDELILRQLEQRGRLGILFPAAQAGPVSIIGEVHTTPRLATVPPGDRRVLVVDDASGAPLHTEPLRSAPGRLGGVQARVDVAPSPLVGVEDAADGRVRIGVAARVSEPGLLPGSGRAGLRLSLARLRDARTTPMAGRRTTVDGVARTTDTSGRVLLGSGPVLSRSEHSTLVGESGLVSELDIVLAPGAYLATVEVVDPSRRDTPVVSRTTPVAFEVTSAARA